eukprot:g6801.t1
MASKRGGAGDDQQLQAILLADSFTKKTFLPISLERPKVLMPLANVPMLQYTLEFLASSGVGELFIFCAAHTQQVERFVAEARCAERHRMKIRCIKQPQCLSAGDALREVDNMGIIRSDPFVLVAGDVVSNVDLAPIIEAHKARKKKGGAIMTTLFKQAGTLHPTRPLFDDLVLVLDNATQQILHYDCRRDAADEDPDEKGRGGVSLPTTLLFDEGHANVQFRYDLLDTHIDICSPEVLVQFSDNFDYQDIRRDFLYNEVQNFELGNKITAHVVQGQYAARVHDPRTYDAVCKDLLHRWAMPLAPDATTTLVPGGSSYYYQRGCIYKERGITLTRPCFIGRDTAIGSGTSVGRHARVAQSVLGRGCKVGTGAVVTGSTLWEGVVVEDGARVDRALLCDGVVVRAGAVVGRGCVLSFGVVVGAGHVVPPFTRVTKVEEEDEFGSDGDGDADGDGGGGGGGPRPWDEVACGSGGEGWVYKGEEGEQDSEEEGDAGDTAAAAAAAGGGREQQQHSIGCVEAEAARAAQWAQWQPPSSSDEEGEDGAGEYFDDAEAEHERFRASVYHLMQTAVDERQLPDNIFLEIKGMKFAQNKTFSECVEALLPPLLDIAAAAGGGERNAVIKEVSKLLRTWKSVIKRCLIDLDTQQALVAALEDYVTGDEGAREAVWAPVFRFVLQMFYDMEFVSDDVMLVWGAAKRELEEGAAERRLFDRADVQEFVEWLEEDDSEEEDSEEEDEEDDEED